jgi:hypothetical protein
MKRELFKKQVLINKEISSIEEFAKRNSINELDMFQLSCLKGGDGTDDTEGSDIDINS